MATEYTTGKIQATASRQMGKGKGGKTKRVNMWSV